MSAYVKGSKKPLGRKNKVYEEGRVCDNDTCNVTIRKYNKSKFCYFHSPVTRGRIRGQQKR